MAGTFPAGTNLVESRRVKGGPEIKFTLNHSRGLCETKTLKPTNAGRFVYL